MAARQTIKFADIQRFCPTRPVYPGFIQKPLTTNSLQGASQHFPALTKRSSRNLFHSAEQARIRLLIMWGQFNN
ncbi:hypothetical protein AA21952_3148 [Acetobacter oeni LMG 21952]|nr:hypothetical protein AA21952_3148 [Acetobacter oeni LMG 21952]